MILQLRLRISELYRRHQGDAFQILTINDFQLRMYKTQLYCHSSVRRLYQIYKVSKINSFVPFLKNRLHLPKWESKMRKRKTNDLENRLFNAGEKHEGNCQDCDKTQIQHYCYWVDLECNQSWLEQEDRKLTRGMGWSGNGERNVNWFFWHVWPYYNTEKILVMLVSLS